MDKGQAAEVIAVIEPQGDAARAGLPPACEQLRRLAAAPVHSIDWCEEMEPGAARALWHALVEGRWT
jgi:hypothetical protein